MLKSCLLHPETQSPLLHVVFGKRVRTSLYRNLIQVREGSWKGSSQGVEIKDLLAHIRKFRGRARRARSDYRQ
jgi:hypothetical protein